MNTHETKPSQRRRHHNITDWAWDPPQEVERAIERGNKKFADFKKRQQQRILDPDSVEDPPERKARKKRVKSSVKKPQSDMIPLRSLVPEGMDTREARRRLRSKGLKGHESRARWEFSPSEAEEIKAFLLGDKSR